MHVVPWIVRSSQSFEKVVVRVKVTDLVVTWGSEAQGCDPFTWNGDVG